MKIYDAALRFTLVREGPVEALDAPDKVAAYIADGLAEHPNVEGFWVIALNRKNRPLARCRTTLGTATASLVHPREVFRPVILAGASACIVAHNHPGGDPSPSQADIRATRQLREAARVLQLDLLDHVIVGDPDDDPRGVGWYSFADAGLL